MNTRDVTTFELFLSNVFFGDVLWSKYVLGGDKIWNRLQKILPQMFPNTFEDNEPNSDSDTIRGLVEMVRQLVQFMHSSAFKRVDGDIIYGEALIYVQCLERPIKGDLDVWNIFYPRSIANCKKTSDYRYYLKEASVVVLLSKVLYLYGVAQVFDSQKDYFSNLSLEQLLGDASNVPYCDHNSIYVPQGLTLNEEQARNWHNTNMQYVWLLANPLED